MALYTYESPEPGDLTFREGDVILVSKKEGDWWNGSVGDRMGLFPGNYVKPKETDVRTLNTASLTHALNLVYFVKWLYLYYFRLQAHLGRRNQVRLPINLNIFYKMLFSCKLKHNATFFV